MSDHAPTCPNCHQTENINHKHEGKYLCKARPLSEAQLRHRAVHNTTNAILEALTVAHKTGLHLEFSYIKGDRLKIHFHSDPPGTRPPERILGITLNMDLEPLESCDWSGIRVRLAADELLKAIKKHRTGVHRRD